MPLEIKILDYGDIELESSFLVLGRDCGRTRRVLTELRRHLVQRLPPGLSLRPLGAAQLLTKPVARDLLMKAIDGQLNSNKPRSGKT